MVTPLLACPQPKESQAAVERGDVNGVTMKNLEVTNLAVGLSVGGGVCSGGSYVNVLVDGNYVHDIHGIYSGSGYGLHTDCAQSVTFRNNIILRAHRHAIYQARTPHPNELPNVIAGNVIIDHAGEGEQYPNPEIAALVLARSNNVTAIDNTLIGNNAFGISAEYDPALSLDCDDCLIIGNKFINHGSQPDLWINARSPVRTWLNTRQLGVAANVQDDTNEYIDSGRAGTFWRGTQALSYMFDSGGDYLYVMQNAALHRVVPDWGKDPETGWRTYWYSTTNWFGFFGMTADDGKVYVMQNNVLHAVTPESASGPWDYTHSTTNWFSTNAVTSMGDGYVFVVQNGIMHRVNPNDWSYIHSTTDWTGIEGLAAAHGIVYAMQSGTLYSVAPGADNTGWARTTIR